jgi:trimethylamine-N-oxide reductase (cytochrome c)
MKLSRRSFNTQIAALGASTAFGPAAQAHTFLTDPLLDARSHLTASHWGIIRAYVEAGRLTRVTPFDKDSFAPSPVIQAFQDQVYAPNRVKYPMVRRDFLANPGKSDTTQRGKGEFVRVSWDDAFGLVAAELERVKKEHGNTAIHTGSTDWHSPGKLHNSPVLVRRMLVLHGGFVDNTGDFSIAAAMVIMPHIVGGTEVYSQPSAWTTVLDKSDLLVLWGCNLFKNNQIGWDPTDHTAYEFMAKLKEKGTPVISIDPRMSDAAKYFGAEWIAPRPNTDTALMLALMHTLHSEKLHDQKFIEAYTVGFKKFLPYLTGETDKTPKTSEWAEKITTIPADKIRDLAHRLVKGRTMIMSGWAIQRQDHGEQTYWALVALASMIGQIGLPGGGFGLSYHYANGGSLTATSAALGGISAGDNAVKVAIPYARGLSDMLLNPGATVDYNGDKITYPDIRLIYWCGGSPFTHQFDRNKQIKAWQKPETVIVNEQFWTANARFADIVLPANTTFERNDIVSASEYSGRFIVGMPQLVESQFESKSDFDILAGISDKLGFKDKFTEGKSEMQWIEEIYNEAVTGAKKLNIDMPAFADFWKGDGFFEFPVPDDAKTYTRYADFRKDPIANALGTPSGKIEIYSKTIADFNYDDCPGHPTWIEPAEWLGSDKTSKHPLHIISPHPKFRLHSQMNNTWLRDLYEVAGREPVWINADDAKPRNIESGDVVRIFNDRGAVLAGAIVTDRIRPGVLMLQEGAWYDPDKPGDVGATCKHGNINVLTMDKGTSKLAQGNIANTVLVEVEKFAGEAPPVTAFDVPVGA